MFNDFSMLPKFLGSLNMVEGMVILFWFLCAYALGQEVPENTCFTPNGRVSQNMRCSNTSEACCPDGWGCTSTGLCAQELDDGSLATVRGSCTVQDWNSGTCASVCKNGMLSLTWYSLGIRVKAELTKNNRKATDNVIMETILNCDPTNNGSWCCNADYASDNCCIEPYVATFSLDIGTITTTAPPIDSTWSLFFETYVPPATCKCLHVTYVGPLI